MRQARHIFKKDTRYLWYEIALVWLFAGAFAGLHLPTEYGGFAGLAQVGLVIAAVLLIGRLILAEALPGDRQFWITRPYRWQSLLTAKILFVVLFVNLPVFAAQFFIVLIDGFALGSSVPGLLWSQLLLFVCVSLPLAAIAAVSSGIAPFILAQLIVIAFAAVMMEVFSPVATRAMGGVDWVRNSIAALAVCAIAIPVLFIQYKSRRTIFSRWVALGGIALGALAFVAMPSSFALAVQSGFSKQPSLGSSILASFGQVPELTFSTGQVPDKIAMVFPILLRGLPEGTDVKGDVFSISLQSPANCSNFSRTPISAGTSTIHVNCFIDTKVFAQQRDRPVTLHASLYFTLFGNRQSRSIPFGSGFFNAPADLQCSAESGGVRADLEVKCRSAFRWPARIVYDGLGGTDDIIPQPVSYSPFPADLSIDPIETRGSSTSAPGPAPKIRDLTIIVEEPLAHLHRDIEAHNVLLDDFADPSVRRR